MWFFAREAKILPNPLKGPLGLLLAIVWELHSSTQPRFSTEREQRLYLK